MRRLVLAATVVGLFVLAACGQGAAGSTGGASGSATSSLKASVYSWSMHDLPLLVGIEKGFFKDAGVNVDATSFESAAAATQAVLAGAMDLVSTTPLNQVIASANNPGSKSSLQQVYAFERKGSWILLAQPSSNASKDGGSAAKLQALKGKTIGVPAIGSEGQLVAQEMLRGAGLDPVKDANYVAVGLGSGAIAQFKAGKIDAIVAVEPVARILIDTAKAAPVYDLAVDTADPLLSAWNQGTYWGKPNMIEAKSDALHRFQTGMDKALAFIMDKANTAEVVKLWNAKLPTFSADQLTEVLNKNRATFTNEVDCTAFNNGQDVALKLGQINESQRQTCKDTVWSGSAQKIVNN